MTTNWAKKERKKAAKARRIARAKMIRAGTLPKKAVKDRPFLMRWRILQEMGYKDYAAYLNGELWKSIRSRVLSEVTECHLCPNKPTAVHHTDYDRDTLAGKKLTSLIPVCNSCHYRIEFKNGAKRTPASTQDYLKAARKRRSKGVAR